MVLLLLAGCRDLLVPGVPTRAEVVAGADYAPKELRERPVDVPSGNVRACEMVDGPTSGFVVFQVEDAAGEPVADAPLGYRTYEKEAWTFAGRTNDIGRAYLEVPVGAQVTVVGLASNPDAACPYDMVPRFAEARPDATGITPSARFGLGKVCPVTVRVTDEGAPVAGAVVFRQAEGTSRYSGMVALAGETDADGVMRTVVPCGRGFWAADPPDGPRAVAGPAEGEVALELPGEWVEVRGVVRTAAGVPIAGAEVGIDPWRGIALDEDRRLADGASKYTHTDEHGRYVLRVPSADGDGLSRWHVGAWYGDERTAAMILARPGGPVGWDAKLETTGRRVEVRCAGLPHDSCEDAPTIECDAPGRPDGFEDRDGYEREGGVRHYRVTCPGGEAVVYAGTIATRIAPDEDVAWLDFRDVDGAIVGQVEGGVPAGARCRAYVAAPFWAQLAGHTGAIRSTAVAADGSFLLDRMPPGPWNVYVKCDGEEVGTVTVQVEDAPIEVRIGGGA